MAMHVCEFEFVAEEDGWILCWPFWPGRADGTQGEDFDDAVEMSADWLREMVLDYQMRGEPLPDFPLHNEPRRGGGIVVVAVEASLAEVPAVTAKEAAGLLGVSGARVSQMCAAGQLDSWLVGRTRMVSRESIGERLAEEHPAGRPRTRVPVGA